MEPVLELQQLHYLYLNTGRGKLAGFGIYTAALAVSGNNGGNVANVEEWNGVSWVEVADVSTARYGLGGTGTTASGVAFAGGPSPSASATATEEWNSPSNVVKTLTD